MTTYETPSMFIDARDLLYKLFYGSSCSPQLPRGEIHDFCRAAPKKYPSVRRPTPVREVGSLVCLFSLSAIKNGYFLKKHPNRLTKFIKPSHREIDGYVMPALAGGSIFSFPLFRGVSSPDPSLHKTSEMPACTLYAHAEYSGIRT